MAEDAIKGIVEGAFCIWCTEGATWFNRLYSLRKFNQSKKKTKAVRKPSPAITDPTIVPVSLLVSVDPPSALAEDGQELNDH